jgi:PAS domain S-box-containing protein
MKHDQGRNGGICVEDPIDYKAVVSVINEAVIIMRGEEILFVNPAFVRLIEKDLSEIMESSFLDFVSVSHAREVIGFIDSVGERRGKDDRIEFQRDTEPGKMVEMKVSVIKVRGKQAILGALSDITERRKKTLETQRLHSRLRSIIDSMRHVVLSFTYSEEDDQVEVKDAAFYDQHLVEINPASEALYGVPRQDFLSKRRSIFDFVHEKDKGRVLNHYNNLYEEGIGELTYRVVGPNNEIRWVMDYGRVEYLERGRVRRVNHIIEDITTEKMALDELRVNEEKYRRIFERSKDMIYILKPDGSFIDINPAGLELLGLGSKEEAVLRNMNEFHVNPGVRDALILEMTERGEATRSRVMLKNTRDETIEVDLNVIARRDDNGEVVSYQGIVHNITEAVRQKELESIGMLAGCFADDLASPLSVTMMGISATSHFLADLKMDIDRLPDPEKAGNVSEIVEGIRYYFDEIVHFNNEAMIACKDIKARLDEIRGQYWKLRKVSDGTGGMIYERESKPGR